MTRLSRSGRLLILLGLAAWAGCGQKNKAAEQRLEELKTNIMTQMDQNKDFHVRNKDKLDGAAMMPNQPMMPGQPVGNPAAPPGTGAFPPGLAPPSTGTSQPSVSPSNPRKDK